MFLPSDFYILKDKNLIFFSSISPGEGFFAPHWVKPSHESTTTDGISATNYSRSADWNGDKFQKCANSKQIDDRNKTNPNNQNHPPILEINCKVSWKSGAGISKLCFRYTQTIPHNNATEDDNLKNNNCDERWPQTSYTDSYCSPRSRAIHN